jgi:hypothetical protein
MLRSCPSEFWNAVLFCPLQPVLAQISTGPKEAGDFHERALTVTVMVTILFAVASIFAFGFAAAPRSNSSSSLFSISWPFCADNTPVVPSFRPWIGELLKLGIQISQATVGRWMPWRPKVPSPTWRSFLRNHLPDIAAIDMFVVATASFGLLYALIVLSVDRRRVVHSAPRYLQRDRDRSYGLAFRHRVRAYHHDTRTHLSLGKDCPRPRRVQPPSTGDIIAFPEFDGLHHRYERRAA